LPDGLRYELKKLYNILTESEDKGYDPKETLSKIFGHIEKILKNYKRTVINT